MATNTMYDSQFLLSTSRSTIQGKHYKLQNYHLFCGSRCEVTHAKVEGKEFYLIGSIYHWKYPESSNSDHLFQLLATTSIEKLIHSIADYAGEFVLIASYAESIYLLHDCCGLAEIFYSCDFKSFASQPKLLAQVQDTSCCRNPEKNNFYNSAIFKNKKLLIGVSTSYDNFRHLLPNTLIDLEKRVVNRYFPNEVLQTKTIDTVVPIASRMLKGILKAMASRHSIVLPVTAGYDSRILLLASLGLDCQYFIYRYPGMTDEHVDIRVGRELVEMLGFPFTIIDSVDTTVSEEYLNSVDDPRGSINFTSLVPDQLVINGNTSEVARNFFGSFRTISGSDLAYLSGYGVDPFVQKHYEKWLIDSRDSQMLGYNLLDLFYWEEKMGIWGAKNKTESLAQGRNVSSPFNCRALLNLLLSVDRKHRDSHLNHLYDALLVELAGEHKEILSVPINPEKKQDMIRTMKKMGIYDLYRFIGLRLRKLQVQ